jgi:hypothetical protein
MSCNISEPIQLARIAKRYSSEGGEQSLYLKFYQTLQYYIETDDPS